MTQKPGRYQTPASVRTALEERQRRRATEQGVPFNRIAQIDVYYRFLARLLHEFHDGALIVKGGLALEMRLRRARTTADIDLRASGAPDHVYGRIRRAGLIELGDFLTFVVEAHPTHLDITGDGVLYRARLATGRERHLGSAHADVEAVAAALTGSR